MVCHPPRSKDEVREDLFAVKVFGDCGEPRGAWCVERICNTLGAAQEYAEGVLLNRHRDYPLMKPKIVHPRQYVVEFYLTLGNQIY